MNEWIFIFNKQKNKEMDDVKMLTSDRFTEQINCKIVLSCIFCAAYNKSELVWQNKSLVSSKCRDLIVFYLTVKIQLRDVFTDGVRPFSNTLSHLEAASCYHRCCIWSCNSWASVLFWREHWTLPRHKSSCLSTTCQTGCL